ncbi:phage tail tube protein [Metaclostridioides mangenotii]|uniref:Phage portal protein n=1 Tax=Metaclostridioides mangenotii TaxID=1540 RepID=A0ABS4EBV7_9FIRM|nr:phage tail tube protein [Clostridioides mangenotii]MBP1855409.1 hypothetical protein [Clostridioides mangenotii]
MALAAKQIIVQDMLAGSQGECYVDIEGNRYHFASIINLQFNFEKTKVKKRVLGRTGAVNKSTGWEGAAEGTIYYNTSVLRMLMYRYKETGEDIYFTTTVSNEDTTSRRGRQTFIAKDCNTDGGILAMLDVDAEVLEEDISMTFDDFEYPEQFDISDNVI